MVGTRLGKPQAESKALSDLAKTISDGKSVLIITGAGLSAASGIPTFRGKSNSIWSQTAASKGKRSVFLRDPLRWYNEFWLRYFPASFTSKPPNAGHEALAALAARFDNVRVITQNVDTLQQQTQVAWPDNNRLIEAHGRLGLYKCIADDDEDEDGENACPYSSEKVIPESAFPDEIQQALTTHKQGVDGVLTEPPRCPHCRSPCPPLALLFDEGYESHDFYRFDDVQEWLEQADTVMFVGTSFAVTITSLALQKARERSIQVLDFNTTAHLSPTQRLDARTILGPCEKTLPRLARTLLGTDASADAPRPRPAAAPAGRTRGRGDGSAGERQQRQQRAAAQAMTRREWTSFNGAASRSRRSHSPGGALQPLKAARTGGRGGPGRGARDGDEAEEEEAAAGAAGEGIADAPEGLQEPRSFTLDPVLVPPLGLGDVRVLLSNEFGRKEHPDPQVEENISTLWEEQRALNPRLFNGLKFRLAGYDYQRTTGGGGSGSSNGGSSSNGSGSSRGGGSSGGVNSGGGGGGGGCSPRVLKLRLALTDYKTFRGTNWSPAAATLATDGKRRHSDAGAYLSQKLGVAALVELSDGCLLAIRRSGHVAEGQGCVDAPGGHPEPEKLGLSGDSLSLPHGHPKEMHRLEDEALTELFRSTVDEVVDETNVPRETLSEPALAGVVLQHNSCGSPCAVFVMQCSLGKEQVLEAYQAGAREAFESTELVFLPREELLAQAAGFGPGAEPATTTTATNTCGGRDFFTRRGLVPTPSLEGCVELWRGLQLHASRGL